MSRRAQGPLPIDEGSRFGGTDGRRFVVEEEVGRGGQAVVFRLLDTRLSRPVALKLCIAPEGVARRRFLERFERELRLTSRVRHPHVLQLHDCGELAGGFPYVMLEWMQLGPLSTLVDRQAELGSTLPLPYVGYYARAMASALCAVHRADIVHRDIKPANILIGNGGVAKLTDFGISRDLAPGALKLTDTGTAMGTPGFMAPEQLGGQSGPLSDIFSFGVTLYVTLTGRLPQQVCSSSGLPLGILLDAAWEQLPPRFVGLIRRLCAPRVEGRPDSMKDAQRLIEQADWSGGAAPVERGGLPPLPSRVFSTGGTEALPVDFHLPEVGEAPTPSHDPDPAITSYDETLPMTAAAPVVLAGAEGDEPGEEAEVAEVEDREPDVGEGRRWGLLIGVGVVLLVGVVGVLLWGGGSGPDEVTGTSTITPASTVTPASTLTPASTVTPASTLTPTNTNTNTSSTTSTSTSTTSTSTAEPPTGMSTASGAEPLTPAAVSGQPEPVAMEEVGRETDGGGGGDAGLGDRCAAIRIEELRGLASLSAAQVACLQDTAHGRRDASDPDAQEAAVLLFNHRATGWSAAVEAALGRPGLSKAPALSFAGIKPAYDGGRYTTVTRRGRVVWANLDKGYDLTTEDVSFVAEHACRASVQVALSGGDADEGITWCERWLELAEQSGASTAPIQDLIEQLE